SPDTHSPSECCQALCLVRSRGRASRSSTRPAGSHHLLRRHCLAGPRAAACAHASVRPLLLAAWRANAQAPERDAASIHGCRVVHLGRGRAVTALVQAGTAGHRLVRIAALSAGTARTWPGPRPPSAIRRCLVVAGGNLRAGAGAAGTGWG